jgi:hypothetical protein
VGGRRVGSVSPAAIPSPLGAGVFSKCRSWRGVGPNALSLRTLGALVLGVAEQAPGAQSVLAALIAGNSALSFSSCHWPYFFMTGPFFMTKRFLSPDTAACHIASSLKRPSVRDVISRDAQLRLRRVLSAYDQGDRKRKK